MYLEAVNFKTKIKALGNTFNLHSNSTNAQEVWTQSIPKGELESDLHPHTHHFTMMLLLHKILYVYPFVSNQLSNWAGLLSLSNWA